MWHEVQNGKIPGFSVKWDDRALILSGIMELNPLRVAGASVSLFSGHQLSRSGNGENVFSKEKREKYPSLQKAENIFRKYPWESSRAMSACCSALFMAAAVFTVVNTLGISAGAAVIGAAVLSNPEFRYGAHGMGAKFFALLRPKQEKPVESEHLKAFLMENEEVIWKVDRKDITNNILESKQTLKGFVADKFSQAKEKGVSSIIPSKEEAMKTVRANGLPISAILLTPAIIHRAMNGLEALSTADSKRMQISALAYTASVLPYGVFLVTKWFADKKVSGLNFEQAEQKKKELGETIHVTDGQLENAMKRADVSKEKSVDILEAIQKTGNYAQVDKFLKKELGADKAKEVIKEIKVETKRAIYTNFYGKKGSGLIEPKVKQIVQERVEQLNGLRKELDLENARVA